MHTSTHTPPALIPPTMRSGGKSPAPLRPLMLLNGTEGTIDLTSDIGDWYGEYSLAQFQKDWDDLIARGATSITLRINSNGGSVTDALGMHDIIAASSVPVTAHVTGMAASAATIVALAASTVTMAKNATWMVHEPTGGAYGTLAECQMALDFFAQLRDKVIDIYTAKTGRPSDDIIAAMNPGTFLTATDALAQGWIDAIAGESAPEEEDPKKKEEEEDPAPGEDGDEDDEYEKKPAPADKAPAGFFGGIRALSAKLAASAAALIRPQSHPTAAEMTADLSTKVSRLQSTNAALVEENKRLRAQMDARAQQQGAALAAAALTTSTPTPAPQEPRPVAKRKLTPEELAAAAKALH